MVGDESKEEYFQLSLNSRAKVAVAMMFIYSFNTDLMCFYYMPGIALILLSDLSSVLLVIMQQNQIDIKIIHL